MGLSASQARFLQLTARRNDVEYEAQQISFRRLQLADQLSIVATNYQDKISNRKLVFHYNDGTGLKNVDVTYQNYKNFMNQQKKGVSSAQDKMFLVSSSGNKIIVANEQEREDMISRYTEYKTGENGEQRTVPLFTAEDFLIVDDLDDVDNFQSAIQDGIYYFAKIGVNSETNEYTLKTESWDTIGGGAIGEEYDKEDDAEAEAEYDAKSKNIQNKDKRLEMRLKQLESERSAIKTEEESISSVIKGNIEKSFNTFG